jgi:hypothetical protein
MKVQLDKSKGIKHYHATDVRKVRAAHNAATPHSMPKTRHGAKATHPSAANVARTIPRAQSQKPIASYFGLIVVIFLNVFMAMVNCRLLAMTNVLDSSQGGERWQR